MTVLWVVPGVELLLAEYFLESEVVRKLFKEFKVEESGLKSYLDLFWKFFVKFHALFVDNGLVLIDGPPVIEESLERIFELFVHGDSLVKSFEQIHEFIEFVALVQIRVQIP